MDDAKYTCSHEGCDWISRGSSAKNRKYGISLHERSQARHTAHFEQHHSTCQRCINLVKYGEWKVPEVGGRKKRKRQRGDDDRKRSRREAKRVPEPVSAPESDSSPTPHAYLTWEIPVQQAVAPFVRPLLSTGDGSDDGDHDETSSAFSEDKIKFGDQTFPFVSQSMSSFLRTGAAARASIPTKTGKQRASGRSEGGFESPARTKKRTKKKDKKKKKKKKGKKKGTTALKKPDFELENTRQSEAAVPMRTLDMGPGPSLTIRRLRQASRKTKVYADTVARNEARPHPVSAVRARRKIALAAYTEVGNRLLSAVAHLRREQRATQSALVAELVTLDNAIGACRETLTRQTSDVLACLPPRP